MTEPREPSRTENLLDWTISSNASVGELGPAFHGVDRVIFAVDEWQHRVHRHLPPRLGYAWYAAWRPFCDWWDARLTGH